LLFQQSFQYGDIRFLIVHDEDFGVFELII